MYVVLDLVCKMNTKCLIVSLWYSVNIKVKRN